MSFGSPFIYSSDTVNVRVVKLKGVRIVIPSTTLITGEEVCLCLCLSLSLPFLCFSIGIYAHVNAVVDVFINIY